MSTEKPDVIERLEAKASESMGTDVEVPDTVDLETAVIDGSVPLVFLTFGDSKTFVLSPDVAGELGDELLTAGILGEIL